MNATTRYEEAVKLLKAAVELLPAADPTSPAPVPANGRGGSGARVPDTPTFSFLPVGVVFLNAHGDDPPCFRYSATDIEIQYRLDPFTAPNGCVYKRGIYTYGGGTALQQAVGLGDLGMVQIDLGGNAYFSVPVPPASVSDPANCTTFVMVITLKCGSGQERIVAAQEFQICNRCP